MNDAIRTRIHERAPPMTCDQFPEFPVGLRLHGHVIHILNLEVLHDAATADVARAAVASPAGQDQILERIEQRGEMFAREVEDDDIGLGAGT